jgi:hypothetical protein
VIGATAVGGRVVVSAMLAPGELAYADADWLVAGAPGPVPALVASGRDLRFGSVVRALAGDPDAAAFAALAAVGAEAARVALAAGPGRVEVLGSGLIAAEARRALGERCAPAGEAGRPAAVVDATGDPAAIRDALARVADMGTLVLAGEALGRGFPLNLYPDVHVRGLRLVGVGPPRAAVPEPGRSEPPAAVSAGAALPPARWYRISS